MAVPIQYLAHHRLRAHLIRQIGLLQTMLLYQKAQHLTGACVWQNVVSLVMYSAWVWIVARRNGSALCKAFQAGARVLGSAFILMLYRPTSRKRHWRFAGY